ncbi:bifunctional selenide/ water dikinase / oxidoreductase fusion protein [Synechococcus sp. MIT S9220]|uniref:selenide, water dikinase SelD n=1 Tax=unclassified Synechococcus TaxID=2626047 RepID=UPI00164C11B3|nr:selenide, water dikinase SelD [Synechococcus sp. MIT S9220]NOL48003.1 selenide, water dikinase SelD [Synechococcus sp. MIT S9220]QNJ21559.1 bifunctional selenide/ water dikinase / oxidoreductase fusion protein [Synechococcus sp. MIT S9220]
MSCLVLAGGGHSHALVLRSWAMQPSKRPSELITLVSRTSTALYSGMVPGLIAGIYQRDQVAIDLRDLANQAGVALVVAEITGLELQDHQLQLDQRPALPFEHLSLNLGAETPTNPVLNLERVVPIKPLEPALAFLANQDQQMSKLAVANSPFQVVGSGLAAVETVLALRQRWPRRPLVLRIRPKHLKPALINSLQKASIQVLETSELDQKEKFKTTPGLLCTGSRAPHWLTSSGLPCCPSSGRIRTEMNLQVIGQPNLFAAGDCAVIDAQPRSPSGVWAVRAATPLARNLEAACNGQPLRNWRPQRQALQLLGGFNKGQPTAWALRGPWLIGPHPLLWLWKAAIDKQFMAMFRRKRSMDRTEAMACRGCAAKLPAGPLERALQKAGIASLGTDPEDSSVLPLNTAEGTAPVLQSVDGFPALVSDPWLNGRLTALHACSDLWACGARVVAAQAVVTLPQVSESTQETLLAQSLAGICSALDPQGAKLIGGHTLEARGGLAQPPPNLAIQVTLSVSGQAVDTFWPKAGVQAGDRLLLSRPLGTGVLFAAAMTGAAPTSALDTALKQMATSQHSLLEELLLLEAEHTGAIHAATDITGFGLLGHLGEMLRNSALRVVLKSHAIPSIKGTLPLLEKGYTSSLAPANRRAWSLLDSNSLDLQLNEINPGSKEHLAMLELLVDPQTCGPLLISVDKKIAEKLVCKAQSQWTEIGNVQRRQA